MSDKASLPLCPFCGGRNLGASVSWSGSYEGFISCADCRATGPRRHLSDPVGFLQAGLDKVVELTDWCQRASTASDFQLQTLQQLIREGARADRFETPEFQAAWRTLVDLVKDADERKRSF